MYKKKDNHLIVRIIKATFINLYVAFSSVIHFQHILRHSCLTFILYRASFTFLALNPLLSP